MWLCSVSRAFLGKTLATKKWTNCEFQQAKTIAHETMEGIGNLNRERAFRMNITFCIHRALNVMEHVRLQDNWDSLLRGMTGGPVEVLWSRGIPHSEAAMPCHNPRHKIINSWRPDLWVPEDCGDCRPCVARIAVRPMDFCHD